MNGHRSWRDLHPQQCDRVSVKALLQDFAGRVLLLRSEGVWELPGGGVEGREEYVDTLRREVFEETGLSGFEIVQLVHADSWVVDGVRVVGFFYWCTVGLRMPPVSLSEEHSARWWADPVLVTALPDATADTVRAVDALINYGKRLAALEAGQE